MYGRYYDNKIYLSFAEDILDEIILGINIDTPYNFSKGLTGIAWGIEFLSQHKFVDCDTNEVCEEIDHRIMESNIQSMEDKSIETGFEGILLYVLARIKGCMLHERKPPFTEDYLKEIYDFILKININETSLSLHYHMEEFLKYFENRKLMYETDIISLLHTEEIEIKMNDLSSYKLGLMDGLAGKIVRSIQDK